MVKAAPEYEKDIREVMRRSDETIEKTDYAETWVRYLKDKGYHVYILSNYATDTLERTEDKLTFLKYVDGAVFSCQVKQIKPEPEIYKTLLGRYHLDPEKSVFLDDRAEKLGYRMREGQIQKVPYLLVIGFNEQENKTVSYRLHGQQDTTTLGLDEFVEKIDTEIKNKAR